MKKRLLEYESETSLPPEIVRYFHDYEDWIREYRYEPDKMFIGLGDLRAKIMRWFKGGYRVKNVDELFAGLMELNNKQVIMTLTASQNKSPFMHICGKLKVTKCSIIEFMVGDAVVRADTIHREHIDRAGGKDIWEISFWMNHGETWVKHKDKPSNATLEEPMNGVHCSIRPERK